MLRYAQHAVHVARESASIYVGYVLCTFARSVDAVEGEPLPTEFCLFKPGVNDSTKGPAVWDAQAAAEVMAEYRQRGVDGMIDLNHDSVDPATRRARKDACDAMGYYQLELRDGALWMTNIRWTAEGEERLRLRKQRYFSPAFLRERTTNRVAVLLNVALVADPATYDARPLIAASRAVPVNMATRAAARALTNR